MKFFWENSWFAIPTLLFFNIGLLLVYFVPYGEEILYFNNLRQEPLNSIFRFATQLGEVYAYIICGVAALFWRYRYTLLIALVGLITVPTVFTLKDVFAVDRPISYFENKGEREKVVTVSNVSLNAGKTSFPSGHTMAGFGLYGILALIVGKKRPYFGLPLALLAILVGVSRVFLVQHFLADILAGALLGLLVSWLVWRLNAMPFFQKAKWLDGRLFPKKEKGEVALKD